MRLLALHLISSLGGFKPAPPPPPVRTTGSVSTFEEIPAKNQQLKSQRGGEAEASGTLIDSVLFSLRINTWLQRLSGGGRRVLGKYLNERDSRRAVKPRTQIFNEKDEKGEWRPPVASICFESFFAKLNPQLIMREWDYTHEEAGIKMRNNSKCRGAEVFSLNRWR